MLFALVTLLLESPIPRVFLAWDAFSTWRAQPSRTGACGQSRKSGKAPRRSQTSHRNHAHRGAKKMGRDKQRPKRPELSATAYCCSSFFTASFTLAVTSRCSFSGTSYSPITLIGSVSAIFRLSMVKPCAASDSEMSDEVTEPKS